MFLGCGAQEYPRELNPVGLRTGFDGVHHKTTFRQVWHNASAEVEYGQTCHIGGLAEPL
jgi:hypothetical protein